MSMIYKFAVISSTVALLYAVAGVANADGHEQARQLLQRSEVSAETRPVILVVSGMARDSHEQARRIIEGTSLAPREGTPVERRGVNVQPDPAVDGHTRARNLLARSLVETQPTRAARTSLPLKTSAKQRAADDD